MTVGSDGRARVKDLPADGCYASIRDNADQGRHTEGMGGSLIEARKRLPSLGDLNHAAALLNIPGLDDAERNTGAPPHHQQAALLARIADWAGLCAKAAREIGDLDFGGATETYAYLIETVDEHQSSWWRAGNEGDSGGIEESPDSAATYAVAVMDRYLDHLRTHLDDYEDATSGELHVRVSVWRVGAVTASASAPRPDNCPPARYGHVLKATRISPHAVEIRTPIQVHQHIHGGGVTV